MLDETDDPGFGTLPVWLQQNVRTVLADPALPADEVERLLACPETEGPNSLNAWAFDPEAAKADGPARSTAQASGVKQPLCIWDPPTEVWELISDYTISNEALGCKLFAFAGYRFDLATVPRPLRWIVSPYELGNLAPLFHDLMYEHQGKLPQQPVYILPYRTFTRAEADELFLHHMEISGVRQWRRNLAFRVVRLLGGIWWVT